MSNRIFILLTSLVMSIAGHAQGSRQLFFLPPIPPTVTDDGRIAFHLRAPKAEQVMVILEGDPLPMEKDSRGVWNLTTEKMEPDIYTYNFLVDSLLIMDPYNPLVKPAYQGLGQSLILVPGSPSRIWEIQDQPHGLVARHIYKSSVIGDQRDFYVYTPPGYDPQRIEPYPVLYLFHGIGDDARAWTQAGYANIILDNLISSGKAKPMIMVNTLGYGDAKTIVSAKGFENFTNALLTEVIPAVEKNYHASKEPGQRAIAGLSMGGAQAIFGGLNHPEMFSWIGGFSSAFIMYSIGASGARAAKKDSSAKDEGIYSQKFRALDSSVNRQIRLLWISCGRSDFLFNSNKDFMDWLTSKNIQYKKIETSGAHTWTVWRRNLESFASLLFR